MPPQSWSLHSEAPLQATAATPRARPRVSRTGDRVQRSNPLRGIVKEFLFEGDVSCVAMAMQGMNYELREPQLRGEAHKSIKADQSGWQDDRRTQTHASRSGENWKKIPVRANKSSLFVGGGVETWSFQNLEQEVQYIKHISQ